MINFFELEFNIPNEYIFADNNTIDELINRRVLEVDYEFILMLKDMVASGAALIIYNPSKYDSNIGTAREYINFGATTIPLPKIQSSEYLEEQKIEEKKLFEQAYGTQLEHYKFEISNIPNSSKFSFYSESNGAVEGTYNCQYTFWMSEKMQYVMTLQCFESEKDSSIHIFNDIIKSIQLK